MAKRKREEGDEDLGIKQRRVQPKLKTGVTKLGHAFKVSKGFERQKLGRRHKTAAAQSNEKDAGRIESEISALKALDTTASAQQHLYKSLLKIKDVSNHPNLPSEVKKPVKVKADSATLNVNARLCKSNQVRDALASVVKDIQQSLGLDVSNSNPPKKRRLRAKDLATDDVSKVRKSDGKRRKSSDVASSNESDQGENGGSSYAGRRTANDRASPSSDEADETDVEALESKLASEGIKRKAAKPSTNGYSLEQDLSLSSEESEARSPSPQPRKAAPSKKASFIPSLTMAGYVSGSGSEAEDIDVAPMKNRRGQRARQQIWEKKFGSSAKHLQNQDRNVAWSRTRGAVSNAGGRNDRAYNRAARRQSPDYNLGGDGGSSTGKVATDTKKSRNDDDGPIHPSWEAAKKAKEKKNMPISFQGKKTTFD